MNPTQLKAAILVNSPADTKAIFDEALTNGNVEQMMSCWAPALEPKPTVFQ
jgi:hypothetical protein